MGNVLTAGCCPDTVSTIGEEGVSREITGCKFGSVFGPGVCTPRSV